MSLPQLKGRLFLKLFVMEASAGCMRVWIVNIGVVTRGIGAIDRLKLPPRICAFVSDFVEAAFETAQLISLLQRHTLSRREIRYS